MRSAIRLPFLAVALGIMQPASAQPSSGTVDRQVLATIQETVGELARAVEHLQEDMIAELGGQKERTLYRLADSVLGDIEAFQKNLVPDNSAKRLSAEYEGVNQNLHRLLDAVRALGPAQRLLQRSALRVRAADDELHYYLGNQTDAGKEALIERQTGVLVSAARQLDSTAEYALDAAQGRGVLVAELHKLREASERFQDRLARGVAREQLRSDFAPVTQAWQRAVLGLKNLRPREAVQLLRSAAHLDRVHERLFRLLGIEGECPRLTVRT